jgi:hypothetical protein
MSIDRFTRTAAFPLTIAVGVAFTNAGCNSAGGDSQTAKVPQEVQKKTEEMLSNMHKNMEIQHKAKGKGGR